MIEMSRDEINQLVSKYLEDEGYIYTLFTFRNEATRSDKPLSHSLISLVGKGLQYLYGRKHLRGSEVVPCEAKFSLSEEHVCDFGGKEPGSGGAEHGSREKKAMDVGVEEVCLDGVGNGLLSCWNGERLGVYTASGEILGFGSGNLLWKKDIRGLTALSWSGDDLVVGNEGGEVITINIPSGRTRSYACHSKGVTRIRQRGRGILSSGKDGRIVMMNNGIVEVNVSECEIEDVVWMGESEVGCSLSDFSVLFVDADGPKISKIGNHHGKVSGMEYNGLVLSTSSYDGTLGLWNTASMSGNRMDAHEGGVNGHRWMNDRIITCGSDGFVKVWDVKSPVPTHKLKHGDNVMAVDCSSCLVASGSLGGRVMLSDTRCREVYRCNVDGCVSSLLFSENGSYLCICVSDGPPRLINLRYF
ncbi:WD-REPEAT PROTEIN SIMILAR TO ANTI-TELOMERIC SILENCING PROTEIN [Encephalitozoon cuniculi GB-M1]|uniref:Wd repeat containing protein n=2 Tax=Encephalitozoon cuniculi TaxID=6035 RepID=M1JKL3_ENCCN|nr:WD domain-containing protein [Encephalitozoon cuniculi GB-M1]AGE96034.1 wd repeat containing protein [Encephalitozoon cuniculi]KMV66752.1 WD domain-containing protein [Encephalitozoon cuniculi EcunIII-L]CAD24969.1 WD-REPEAT PROTEIN SIMILAR TO ANTI-TELOMERIC SILENCING PROTEIN [Encephalitozoon cuniculi GB-M1]